MPQAERYEPTGELHVFDGGEDEDAPEEEGSRLALLLVLALFVLGAFGGVVYLAYNQGVKQGRDEAPRPVVQSTQMPHKLAAAQKSVAPEANAPSDEDLANEDSAPPPPTAIAPAPKVAVPQVQALTQNVTPKPTPASPTPQTHALAQNETQKSTPAITMPQSAHVTPSPVTAAQPVSKPVLKTSLPPSKPLTHNVATTPASTATPNEATHAPKVVTPAASPASQTKLPPVTTPKQQVAATTTPAPPPPTTASRTSASPEPATTSPVPPVATAAAKSAGGFVLQIGAYKSEAEAMASWRAYKSAHAAAASYEPDIRQVELPGKGTWYRLRIGSFTSPADAGVLCDKLKASGGSCFPAKR